VRFAGPPCLGNRGLWLKQRSGLSATEADECGRWQAAEATALQSLNAQPAQIELRERGAIEAIGDA